MPQPRFSPKSGPMKALTTLEEQTNSTKDYEIRRDCLAKVKYTGKTTNIQTHLQCHHPELLAEWEWLMPSQAAAVNGVFKVKLPFSSRRASRITTLIAGFICKDLSL